MNLTMRRRKFWIGDVLTLPWSGFGVGNEVVINKIFNKICKNMYIGFVT